jgi:hypothetical protein
VIAKYRLILVVLGVMLMSHLAILTGCCQTRPNMGIIVSGSYPSAEGSCLGVSRMYGRAVGIVEEVAIGGEG